MSSHSASDGPGEPTEFVCEWSAAGEDGAAVRVAGELDMVTAPQVAQVLQEALEHARLVVINLRALSFADSSGLHVLLDATRQAREGGSRLVLVGASAELERLFAVTGTRALVDILPGAAVNSAVHEDAVSMAPDTPAGLRGAESASLESDSAVQPLKNPVNAGIITARVMDIPDRGLWMHSPDGSIRRAWAPAVARMRVPADARVEIYLDRRGAVNGWWHADSGLAVNQRQLAAGAEPATAPALACQGPCGLLWTAPAAARLLDHDERCLTCAGALALS
jgi:anti-anti-sigma factor